LASALSLDLSDLKPQIDDFVFIADTLQSLGHDYQIDIASVRGFEYYTGVLFQLFIGDEKVGGGGRYDALIPAMSGQNTPASGFALYLDLLMRIIEPSALSCSPARRVLVRMDADATKPGFEIAKRIRESGFTVKLHLGGKGPTDTTWKLEVRSQAPQFVLNNLVTNKKDELQSPEEVIEKLERS
jgi:histidyl-tRNA synthetase